MVKVRLLCFGKLDKPYLLEAVDDYAKRLSRFCDLEIVEIKESFEKDPLGNFRLNQGALERRLQAGAEYQTFILDINSKSVSSEEFAKLVAETKDHNSGKLQLVIGPSDGFDKSFLKKYRCISFGAITLPHQLFRVVLLEQLYRAFKIIAGETYHK